MYLDQHASLQWEPNCAVYKSRKYCPHDVDVLVKLGKHEVPIQVGMFNGAFLHDNDDVTDECVFVDTRSVNERDTKWIRDKIQQTPPGGIMLLAVTPTLWPNDDWWYDDMDKKCVVLWQKDLCSIYHGMKGPIDAAKKLCNTLGHIPHIQSVKPRRSQNPKHKTHLQFCPGTAAGLADAVRKDAKKWTDNPDDIIGALYYPAYASAYFDGLWKSGGIAQVNNLVPIIQHVVERYNESVAADATDKKRWQKSVSCMLSTLEVLSKKDDATFSFNTLIEICHILQDVASKRHDDYVCNTLLVDEINKRLHLQALFCITHMVYRLRDKTPPDVRKTLTAAARCDGQEGVEHRIVLGYVLRMLQSAIPDWYAENESLLFGEDSPGGMNSVLMRVCSHTLLSTHLDIHHTLDVQTMEKYRTLVLEALDVEMRHMRKRGSKTGDLEPNDLMKHFICHVLFGSRGYGIEDSVRDLTNIGPDAVSVAGRECGLLIQNENTEKKFVERAVRFWEAVLDSSPKEALYGFGGWAYTKSVKSDTLERLMLRTCEAAGGRVDESAMVFERASLNGHPTESGIRIIELVLHANKHLSADLVVLHTLGMMRKNGVSIDIT